MGSWGSARAEEDGSGRETGDDASRDTSPGRAAREMGQVPGAAAKDTASEALNEMALNER